MQDLSLLLLFGLSLEVVLHFLLFVYSVIQKIKADNSVAQIDENHYYGNDGMEMDSIRDHRVVDTNEYYDTY